MELGGRDFERGRLWGKVAPKKSMGVKRVKRRTKREQKACVLLTKNAKITSWRGGRVAEGDGLLNRYTA